VPPGTYLIKKTLILWRQTLLFGEWSNPPTLVLAPNSPDFQDPRNPKPFLVTAGGYNVRANSTDWKTRTDQYNGSTNNTFYIFLEDLKVKVGASNPGCDHAVLWACAQQTGIRNVGIDGGGAAYALEAGMNGGGGVWDGLTVANSINGVLSSSCSEMMVRNCTLNTPVTIGGYYLCCWDFLGCTFNNRKGVTLANQGFVSILDSQFVNDTPLSIGGACHLEQVQFASRSAAPASLQAHVSSTGLLAQWTSGQVIQDRAGVSASSVPAADTSVFQGTGDAFAYPRPTAACVNIKALGAKGDGSSDDTAVIQNALANYSEIFFPLGTYVVRGPLVVRGQQKLFGQSAGTIIALAAGSPGFGYGSGAPFVSVTGRGTVGQAIVGIWFWNWADGGQGGLFNADSSSVVMDCQWINKNPNNSQPALNFQSGGCFVENAWNPADGGGASQVGVLVTTDSPLELFGVQAEHFRGSAMRVQGASNVFSLNLQFELSPSYLSITNSSNIYMSGILAGNWNFNANELVNVRDSKVSLFALNVNLDRSGVVDDTTNGNAYYGPVDTTGRIVGLSGFLK
jgi:Pectate lyase superfamily protein